MRFLSRFSLTLASACTLTALATLSPAAMPAARAAFLIDPTGGNSLDNFTSNGSVNLDDGATLRALGGNFSLYGTNQTSLYVRVNGFLSAGNANRPFEDRSVGELASFTSSPVIAPYYDDLHLNGGFDNSIVENVVAGSYYAVTYSVNGENDDSSATRANFQTVLFTGNTTINGTNYLAGDIVFSYGNLNNTITDSNFSVGVAENASNATNAFGAPGGQFASNASFLANFNRGNQAILFRFVPVIGNSAGSYTQSLVTIGNSAAAPEPGSLALLGLGALPLVGMVARRRRS